MEYSIYNSLIYLGVSNEDRKVNLKDDDFPSNFQSNHSYSYLVNPNSAFNNWLSYYRNSDKIRVFHNDSWQYFCQFISEDRTAEDALEHIKVYVPLDANHIEEGAKRIFNFLTINNIPHLSKIGKKIRFDDIVIRLTKKEDADRLLDFIKHDSYIQHGLIKPNPFAYQKDGIALACDGQESYNETTAKLIDLYIDEKKRTNTLNQVDYSDFYKFVASKYKSGFINKEDNDLKYKFDIDSKEKERNYREIVALMLKTQDPKFSYEDLINHFNTCKYQMNKNIYNPIDNREKEPTKMQSYISSTPLDNKIATPKPSPNRQFVNNVEQDLPTADQLLTEYINAMVRKFDERKGRRTCAAYFDTGYENYITRDNNLRNKIVSSTLRETINAKAKQRGMTVLEYINLICPPQINYEYH